MKHRDFTFFYVTFLPCILVTRYFSGVLLQATKLFEMMETKSNISKAKNAWKQATGSSA
jgi:hypothetical protein